MENEVEQQDSQNPAGETEASAEVESIETLKTKLSEIEKQKNELHGRATRAESELKQFKQKPEDKPEPVSSTLDDIEDRVELRQQGYSREEVQKISSYAKANKMSLLEAAKDDFVQGGIEKARAKTRSTEATPSAKKQSAALSLEELKKLTPAQRAEKQSFSNWKDNNRRAGRASS